MKTLTLLAFTFVFFNFANAQITKGSTFLGGSAGGNSNKQETTGSQNTKSNNLGVRLEVGKAIADNKIAGLFASYNHGRTEYDNLTNKSINKNNNYGGGVFYRQYFPLSSKWYLFGTAAVGYFATDNKGYFNNIQDSKDKGWSVMASITPGISFAAGRRLHIETSLSNLLSIGYDQYKTQNFSATGVVTSTSKTKSFGGYANISGFSNLAFGLRWILPSKKK